VVVDNFNVCGVAKFKPKTYTPTAIDADAPLAGQITRQRLKPVGWRLAHIFNSRCRIELRQSHDGAPQDVWRQTARFARHKKSLGFRVAKVFDHGLIINILFIGKSTLSIGF
jgi:hypothetical protein